MFGFVLNNCVDGEVIACLLGDVDLGSFVTEHIYVVKMKLPMISRLSEPQMPRVSYHRDGLGSMYSLVRLFGIACCVAVSMFLYRRVGLSIFFTTTVSIFLHDTTFER